MFNGKIYCVFLKQKKYLLFLEFKILFFRSPIFLYFFFAFIFSKKCKMNNSIKAFCALKCVEGIRWIILILLCFAGVIGINYGIFHNIMDSIAYAGAEFMIVAVGGFGISCLFLCIVNAKREYSKKKAELDSQEIQKLVEIVEIV